MKLSAFRDNSEFTVVSSKKTCLLMRLTKISASGDEINENKKISPVLKKNIMKKNEATDPLCTVYLNGSTYGNKSARSL